MNKKPTPVRYLHVPTMLFPENERQRLDALYQYQVLDTPTTSIFDDLVQIAADFCEAPIALITFVDVEREWFKSKIGTTITSVFRNLFFGQFTILENDILIVSDTLQDSRFAHLPLVISEPYYRFYAGVPLINHHGFPLGCFCIIDFAPRNLTMKEQGTLKKLATIVTKHLNLHRKNKLIERNFQEIDAKFQAITQAIPIPLIISRLSDGLILYGNQQFLKTFGWNADDVVHRQISDLYDNPNTIKELLDNFTKLGFIHNYEVKLKKADGTVFWAIASVQILSFYGEISILKLFNDITNRKDIEIQIKEQNDFLRSVFTVIPLMIIIIDTNNKIKWVNQEWERVMGWNLQDIQTMNILEALYPNPEYRQDVINFIESKKQIWGDFRTQLKDGRIIDTNWINIQLSNGETIAIGQDITERKQSERGLKIQAEREQLMRTIGERIRQSLNLQDILNVTVEEVRNLLQVDRVIVFQFAPDMNGIVVAESVQTGWTVTLGQNIQDTCLQTSVTQNYYQGNKRAIANIYEAGLSDCHIQLLTKFEVKANLVVPILLEVDAENMSSRLWGLLIAHQCSDFRDWETSQLDLLDQLTVQIAIAIQQSSIFQQAQSELFQRQEIEVQLRGTLAEKEVLLKEIHHRVKNNLQIVSSLLQLQSHTIKDVEILKVFRESQNRIESISLIHKNLYTAPNIGQLDVADYINNLAGSLLSSYQIFSSQIILETYIDPVNLNVDQAIACGLIINELISNTLKHAFPNQQIGNIIISLHNKTNLIEMIVQDDGIGLPNNLNWKNTDSLGLSLVYDLVTEQLEGTITVERNHGTVFYIQFPQLISHQ